MSFTQDLQKTLDTMGWPSRELKTSTEILTVWTEQVQRLLDLQSPHLPKLSADDMTPSETWEWPALLPIEVMVQPLALRFRYHFYGDKPTNRLDKPEYFLSHILDILDQHAQFMSDHLQPILSRRSDAASADDVMYPDAVSAFITALLPVVAQKALLLLQQISTQPALLSHFIHELMSFDTTIRDAWAYIPNPQSVSEWKGLTWSMLTTHAYFAAWLEAEKNFALSRYKVIRDSADSGDIDADIDEPGISKPTKGAIRVNDLLETITDRYRGLSSFSQKLKFLIDIQLAIFDDYHNHLHGSLQAYLVSSHAAGRLIHGQTMPEVNTSGVRALESLAKIFGSADYLEHKMLDWSDDVFFLELWDELQYRAQRNTGANGAVGHDLQLNEVASKTSATIMSSPDNQDQDSDGGALFDETAATYHRLRERSEVEIVHILENSLRASLRSFTKMAMWASLTPAVTDLTSLSPSAALDSTLQTVSSHLGYLANVLAGVAMHRVAKQTTLTIQKEIWDNIILRHSFSESGAVQLKRDVMAIEDVIDSSVKVRGEARRAMKKLDEALLILSLPVGTSSSDTGNSADDGEAWGFDEEGEEETFENKSSLAADDDPDKLWTLLEVERRLFENNQAARHVLAAMGIETVGEGEARNIVERRVEISR